MEVWLHEPDLPPRPVLPPRPLLALPPRKGCLAADQGGREGGAGPAGGGLLAAGLLGALPRRGGALDLRPPRASMTFSLLFRASPRVSREDREDEWKTRPGSTGRAIKRSFTATGKGVSLSHNCLLTLTAVLRDSPKSLTI